MFEGSRIGKKLAKVWNMNVLHYGALCPRCLVDCGREQELANHLRKHHDKEKSNA